jgi:hypothetical protein
MGTLQAAAGSISAVCSAQSATAILSLANKAGKTPKFATNQTNSAPFLIDSAPGPSQGRSPAFC